MLHILEIYGHTRIVYRKYMRIKGEDTIMARGVRKTPLEKLKQELSEVQISIKQYKNNIETIRENTRPTILQYFVGNEMIEALIPKSFISTMLSIS